MDKSSILIAEDDRDLVELLNLMLEDDFDISVVVDGENAIDILTEKTFLFAVIDVHLPGKSGLDVCAHIQTLPPENQPGVIIMSGDMSDESINRAYALGAGDYIGKPFNVVAFHRRLMRFARDLLQINKMRQDDKQKHSIAETAMKHSAAYGSGLELLARLNHCHTVEDFLQNIAQGFHSQGYHTAIECRYHGKNYQYDVDTHTCNENERKVFQLLHDSGRIYNFGKRAIFNEVHTSILVKNMPIMGTLSYDSAVDLFAKLVPAINSRFLALMHTYSMRDTREALGSTVEMVSNAIMRLQSEKQEQLQGIANEISVSFHELDMTEAQENFFLNLIEKKLSNDSYTEQFAEIISLLQECLSNLEEDEIPTQPQMDSNSSDDIELF